MSLRYLADIPVQYILGLLEYLSDRDDEIGNIWYGYHIIGLA